MKVMELTPEGNLPSASTTLEGVHLWWLGQAGFLISMGGLRIVIDPYLSNSLAKKYATSRFPHLRMTPPPISPEELTGIDWLLCTHAHTDHMDPETIVPLLMANPGCRVLVPRAEMKMAITRGVPENRLVGIDADECLDLGDVSVIATPAKHEVFLKDDFGHQRFLGYILRGGNIVLHHPGDCIPFFGQEERLAPHNIDIALLPVNGRDEERAANGIPGNMTLDEAVNLTERVGARAMLGHHFGTFDFNTLDPDLGRSRLAKLAPPFDGKLAEAGQRYSVFPRSESIGPFRILFVSHRNSIRSPLAEAFMRRLVGNRTTKALVEINSAAITNSNAGQSPDPRAIAVARVQGVEISDLRARQIDISDFGIFDLIIGMDDANLEALRNIKPTGSRALILSLAGYIWLEEKNEISDLSNCSIEIFEETCRQIEAACITLMNILKMTGRINQPANYR